MGIETIMHILVREEVPSSLDELVQSLQAAWLDAGLPAFLALLLHAMDAWLLAQWRGGELLPPACCEEPLYEVRDRKAKSARTSLGKVSFRWHRLTCAGGAAPAAPSTGESRIGRTGCVAMHGTKLSEGDVGLA